MSKSDHEKQQMSRADMKKQAKNILAKPCDERTHRHCICMYFSSYYKCFCTNEMSRYAASSLFIRFSFY